ncbi:hypothetical protein Lfu02_42830 [Longispora fulva]|uniref:Uncharacterized protein n=1 Tax=Longispora fulva TaxID=619741 RepID=A0A8J7GT81_9ACTN|nr:hypothetical protein [Longispora fulva]MBG6136741.1 hypothetical protein [Longispora fulva]GIG59911.1 hypothetical protein Lfu02_42830 [Longispora fulva]
MGKLSSYGPPGRLTDLNDVGCKMWNVFISDSVDQAAKGPDPKEIVNDSPRPQFYNLTTRDTAADAVDATVRWTAFPRRVQVHSTSDNQRWQRADASRDVQDEYCEWSVERDAHQKVTRVTFTCEGPEYWDVLAQTSPDKVLELYRTHINPAVLHATSSTRSTTTSAATSGTTPPATGPCT